MTGIITSVFAASIRRIIMADKIISTAILFVWFIVGTLV